MMMMMMMMMIIILGGQNPQKLPKIVQNRHFLAKMSDTYNSNIFERVRPVKLKFEAEPGI